MGRRKERAKELKLVLPDPSILLKAVMKVVAKPITSSPEVAFRVQSARYQLGVDVMPTEERVMMMHKILQAELQQVALTTVSNP